MSVPVSTSKLTSVQPRGRTPELLSNQKETLRQIEAAVLQGASNITVWGLSGTGKSQLAEALRLGGRFESHDDFGSPAVVSMGTSGRIPITFRTGIPSWFNRPCDKETVLHKGFELADLEFLAKGDTTNLQGAIQTHWAVGKDPSLVDAVCKLGLGSTVLFDSLCEASNRPKRIEAVVQFVNDNCLLGAHSAPKEAFSAYVDQLANRELLPHDIEEVINDIQTSLAQPTQDKLSVLRNSNQLRRHRYDKLIAELPQQLWGVEAIPAACLETVEWYSASSPAAHRLEPSFVVRSGRQIEFGEWNSMAAHMPRILHALGSHVSGRGGDAEWQHLAGQNLRKTTLSLFRSQGALDGCQDGSHLWPLISKTQGEHNTESLKRTQLEVLYRRGLSSIPDNTLILAGGDHLYTFAHAGLCFAVELLLQRRGIPYEVVRGDFEENACCFDFNGSELISPGTFYRAR